MLTPMQRLRNQQEAWLKGKRVMLVIDAAGNKAELKLYGDTSHAS